MSQLDWDCEWLLGPTNRLSLGPTECSVIHPCELPTGILIMVHSSRARRCKVLFSNDLMHSFLLT